jgi:transforming growth factor-beta-induced protein
LEGAKRAAELGGAIETLGGESLTLPAGAVITPDVPLSNGVLHVTNTLFVPPSLGTVAGLVLLNPGGDLGKFGQAMQKAALADDFMDPAKQFTFFAPTDAAFAAAGIDLDKATPAELEKIVRYHVVNGKLMQANLPNGPLTTHQGSTVNVSGTTLTDAKGKTANLVQTDQTASNGVLHKINQVLSPAN